MPDSPAAVSREEFERFLHALTHEIRNRLNGIALEAADLAEQAGPQSDSTRLQQQIQDCSTFLKKIRTALAPDDTQAERTGLAEFVKAMREEKKA